MPSTELDLKTWKELTATLGATLKKLSEYSTAIGKPKFAELFENTRTDLDDDMYLIDPQLGRLEW